MTQHSVPGTLYIISAPSGGGKTSLVNALLSLLPNLQVSISHTTRSIRPGEKNGVNYHFIDETAFQALIKQHAFFEYASVFGNYYGTSRLWVEDKLRQGTDIILEIDWQGAQQIRKLMPATIGIFIIPPSWQALEARLRERAQDNASVIAKRMAAAHTEMSHYHEYDYLVVNDDFNKALSDLKSIIQACRLQKNIQTIRYAELLLNLLQ